MNIKKILVVGAGPAGVMAAIRAGELGARVTLIEKNPILGKKLLLSGKGRCNLTNNCEFDEFLERFSYGGQFLRDAFKKFFNRELINFFEKNGVQLKVERQLRVFPTSDRSSSIANALSAALRKAKVKVCFASSLSDILVNNKSVSAAVLRDRSKIYADKIILATGGVSYQFCGSTGDGINVARKLGHKIVNLRPGLVALEVRQGYPKLLEGLALVNIRLDFSDGKTHIISDIGEMLFTSFGISGPLVLSLSGKIVDRLALAKDKPLFVEIDLKPALTPEQLNSRLLREFELSPKKNIKSILKGFLPVRLIGVFLSIAKVPSFKQVSQITVDERKQIVKLLKALRLDIAGPRPIEEAMVTRGGVSLKEINPKTMESRLIKGLYFAGEMIDVDADTGGFNLQAAFSTGYLAGESAATEPPNNNEHIG